MGRKMSAASSERNSLRIQHHRGNNNEDGTIRRSSLRQLAMAKITAENENAEDRKGNDVLSEESSSTNSPGSRDEERVKEAETGVTDAIKGLARIERRLQRATKRQKLKVEESTVTAVDEPKVATPYVDKNPKNKGSNAPPRKSATAAATKSSDEEESRLHLRHLPTPELDTVEADMDQDVEHGLPATQVADRGAARPPAVNSDYLPLPWKGRLGYVSRG